ncbi:MAG: rane protein [Thermoplasmata archaeon]|jgi:membrane protein|nr:rane protein [Thermoplasmata archaeon]
MGRLRSVGSLLKQTGQDYLEDKVPRLAAALAYYALFALAPLLLILIAVAGLVFGADTVRDSISGQAASVLGADSAEFIDSMVANAGSGKGGTTAAVFGTIALIFGAGGVFVQLQDALNTVWEVKPKPGLPIVERIRNRLTTYAFVMAVAFLLLVSLAVSAALSSLSKWNDALNGPDWVWLVVDWVVSLGVLALVFAVMFKALPDAKVKWRDVWVGAFATAALFSVGKVLLGLYLGRPAAAATFGAASALVLVILWVYYCAQLVLLGAEFTQSYAHWRGRAIQPDEDAVPVTQEARAQQGMD